MEKRHKVETSQKAVRIGQPKDLAAEVDQRTFILAPRSESTVAILSIVPATCT
ncbi:hypothetical protein CI1B_31330 [Bradyrhizobium ivorense]|uniref:Uncharacterized protein n=1 Tax=Bradyrhizobium ivorense TaxID=2511166 RepID=A0A508T6D6_9BRAD|nr:hypothetical protein CI1B_31330 [Bradyrhizobium ivorense]VIO79152.1 hypothetical protein CI41S_67200 [Bradyrhizobium ivorense]